MKNLLKVLFFNLLFTTSLIAQDEEFGLASYYSDLFHGKPTASGESYDKNKLTCAHKSHPFGTMLRVTRLDNNKAVQVKVTDRGPFISGRVVEVSRAAAESLGLISDGSTRVKVEVVKQETKPAEATVEAPKATEEKPKVTEEKPKPAEKEVATSAKNDEPKEKQKTETAAKPKEVKEDKPANTEKSAVVNKKPAAKEDAKEKAQPASKAVLVKGSQYEPFDLFEIELKKPEKKGFGVQVAVLSTQDALFKKIADLQEDWFSSILVSVQKGPKGEVMYKVILGAFETENEASNYKANLKKNKKMDGFVVDLSSLDAKK